MKFNFSLEKLKPNKSFFQTLLFLLVVFVISSLSLILGYLLKNINPSEYGLIKGAKEDLEITYKEILFYSTIILALFILSLSFRHIKQSKLKLALLSFATIYLIAAFIIVFIDCIYYLIFSYRINFSAIQTILNSNPEEAKEFVTQYYSADRLITLLIFIGFFLITLFKRNWFIQLLSTHSFYISSMLLSVFGVVEFAQMAHSKGNGPHNVRYWDIIIGEYNEYNEFNRRLETQKNSHTLSKEYSSFYKKDTLTKTLVLIISESLSKRHMSMYGYSRATTPNLDTNKNIFKFNDCVTQSALTIEAVPGLFFNGYLSKRIDLITLLNKLGYETSWISNQSGWGKSDKSIVLLSQLCKNRIFMDSRADDEKSNSSIHYDESVLAQFDKVLNSKTNTAKFIVLHFMGCHFDYEKRYPLGKNFYTSTPPAKTAASNEHIRKTLNSYDNAMHYHDSTINEVIKIFTKYSESKNSALVFLSDHGEELYENRNHAGHGYPPSKMTSEIPYFTILSKRFKENFPNLTEIMKQRTNTPYSTVNNFYTVIHLLNIDSKKHKNKILKNSFFSTSYDSTPSRFVMGIDYRKIAH